MLMAVLLAGAVVLGWIIAYGTTSSEGSSRAPKLDRRLRWVERHPGEVNTGDVERVLLAGGLCVADVRLVSQKAFELHIRPFTMWMWVKQYGARELAVAVAAETSHDTLLEHLSEGTLPNFAELEVFAGLNGLVAAAERSGNAAQRSTIATSTDPEPEQGRRRRTLADLDIHEPGEWPHPPRRQQVVPVTEPQRLPPGWDSFFDDLAA